LQPTFHIGQLVRLQSPHAGGDSDLLCHPDSSRPG
jgi:hypothetical protein